MKYKMNKDHIYKDGTGDRFLDSHTGTLTKRKANTDDCNDFIYTKRKKIIARIYTSLLVVMVGAALIFFIILLF